MAKRRGSEFWRGHIAAWRQSDLTQAAYCAGHGLSLKSFYRWHRVEKEAIAAGTATLTLVPVNVGMPMPGGVIRVHSPGSWRIELPIGDAAWLAYLLRSLP